MIEGQLNIFDIPEDKYITKEQQNFINGLNGDYIKYIVYPSGVLGVIRQIPVRTIKAQDRPVVLNRNIITDFISVYGNKIARGVGECL